MFLVLIIHFVSGIFYAIDTYKGKVKPNKVSFGLWALAPFIGAAATLSKGFTWSVFPVIIAGLNPLMVFIASFFNKKSYWKLGKLDYFCLVLSLFAIILWIITRNSLYAVIFSVLADLFASIPTLIKIYRFPQTERPYLFIVGGLSSLFGLSLVNTWGLNECLFPIYLITINILLVFGFYFNELMLFYDKRKKNNNS
ncbi:hypothetical protein EOM39_06670 [Candidatus Gracilibacteria bacterium]|nr:hypothetical protein [Candidatus Gracilibacteria bacterium]